MINLEQFCYDKAGKIAIKFGVIGLGQMGGILADSFDSLKDAYDRKYYEAVAINSYYGDLKPLKSISHERRLQLEGGEGCGRKPELCFDLLKNPANQNQIVQHINYIKDCQMFVVTAGLGGGTGTGLLIPTIKTINYHINAPLRKENQRPKAIGAIVSIPRKTDPIIEKRNAVKALDELKELINAGQLNFLIIIDNEKAFREYRELRSRNECKYERWEDYANSMIVSSFHELNLGICYPGNKNFDPRDLKNIFEDNPGCLSISKLSVPATDIANPKDIISKIDDCLHNKNVLANGFNFKNARQAGFLLVKPKTGEITKDLMDDIDLKLYEEMPETITRPYSCIDWNNDQTNYVIYTIAKVKEFPLRAQSEIQEELNDKASVLSEKMQTEKISTTKCTFNDSIFSGTSETSVEYDNPFEFSTDTSKKTEDDNEDYSILFK